MFEFLFKYPSAAFARGEFVLLAGWPAWILGLALIAAAAALVWRRRQGLRFSPRSAAIGLLQTAFLALLLLLLWHPALSVASLKPQENIIAVLVDDSRSMALREGGRTRLERAREVLGGGLLSGLGQRFQTRLYRFGSALERVEKPEQLVADAPASRIGEALKSIAADASSLPIGAVVLLSDGADNSGGVDREALGEVRRRRIPVHTIGFGEEKPADDIEIEDVAVAPRALAGSRLGATVSLRSYGYRGRRAKLTVRDGGKVLASREIELNGGEQTEAVLFNAGAAGARNLEIGVDPQPGERNTGNNRLARLVNVDGRKPRILYIEGEPRWEMKFIRRAIEEDSTLQLASMLRTTQNKIYRQGIANPQELEAGLPANADELFAFEGLIVGTVESAYFTPAQQELIREFVDRRGGGLLFLGGRASLADGGYGRPPFSDLLPVSLPSRTGTFHRDNATVELTGAGRESLICRLAEDPQLNAERWKKMPMIADYQETGEAKPGAVVLANASVGRRTIPLLATQNYGRGRTAVFATGGSWRWQMRQDASDQTHETFWRQLLRWLVTDVPGRVSASVPNPVLSDVRRVSLRAEVHDKAFRAVAGARVEARIIGPNGLNQTIELEPRPREEGVYTAEWEAEAPGSYLAEIVARRGEEEIGRDVAMFRREDGVAENFRTEQNRELLEKIAAETGGRHYRPEEAPKLAGEIGYSEAGVTVRETLDLWDMPAVFLLALAIRSAEWLLRRKWGLI
jgi:hypothetical protein